jgi:hypothetical protein
VTFPHLIFVVLGVESDRALCERTVFEELLEVDDV